MLDRLRKKRNGTKLDGMGMGDGFEGVGDPLDQNAFMKFLKN